MIYFIQFLINTKLKCNFPRGILASCSGTQQIFKRMAQNEPEGASLCKKSRGPLSTEIEIFFLIPYLKIIGRIEQTSGLAMSSKACQKMCYFQFMINGETSERVIFKMNEDMAPPLWLQNL